MEKVLIITDAPSDLSKDDVAGLPIWVAPVRVFYDGTEHIEFYELDIRQYWKDLARLEEIPTTIMANPEWWMESYCRAAQEGYTHVIVHVISSTASGVYDSSRMGAKMFSAQGSQLVIEHIDSLSYSFIYGRNVLAAGRMARDGVSFAEICASLRELTAKNTAVLWVYSLKHLKKSGRISGMAAFVGETLGLRPLLEVKNGKIEPFERIRGDKNLIPKAVSWVEGKITNADEQTIVLLHADIPQNELDRAVSAINETLKPKAVMLREIGCSVTTNTGPFAMAVVFYSDNDAGALPG